MHESSHEMEPLPEIIDRMFEASDRAVFAALNKLLPQAINTSDEQTPEEQTGI